MPNEVRLTRSLDSKDPASFRAMMMGSLDVTPEMYEWCYGSSLRQVLYQVHDVCYRGLPVVCCLYDCFDPLAIVKLMISKIRSANHVGKVVFITHGF